LVFTTYSSRANTSQFAVSSALCIGTLCSNTVLQFVMLNWVLAPDPWTLKTDSVSLRNIPCWHRLASHSQISRSCATREKYRYCDHKGYNTVQHGKWVKIFPKEYTAFWCRVQKPSGSIAVFSSTFVPGIQRSFCCHLQCVCWGNVFFHSNGRNICSAGILTYIASCMLWIFISSQYTRIRLQSY
jgi:hypothetical protein